MAPLYGKPSRCRTMAASLGDMPEQPYGEAALPLTKPETMSILLLATYIRLPCAYKNAKKNRTIKQNLPLILTNVWSLKTTLTQSWPLIWTQERSNGTASLGAMTFGSSHVIIFLHQIVLRGLIRTLTFLRPQ